RRVVGHVAAGRDENELRARVDEPSDEPRGAAAVHVRSRSGRPLHGLRKSRNRHNCNHGFFLVHRNVVLVGVAAGLFALGESLWLRFAPLYLQALGAGVLVVGLWGTLYDALDAAWQYPAGHVVDRLGARRALVLLTLAAVAGLAVFLAPWWPV